MSETQYYNGVSLREIDEAIIDAKIRARCQFRKLPRRAQKSCMSAPEDLVNVAMLGVVKAIHGFNKSNGTTFKYYASRRALGEILDYFRDIDHVATWTRQKMRKEGKQSQPLLELDSTVPFFSGKVLWKEQIVSKSKNQHDLFQEQEIHKIIDEALPLRDALIIKKYYFEELEDKQIAEIVGLKYARVCQIRNKALKTLRTFIEGAPKSKKAMSATA